MVTSRLSLATGLLGLYERTVRCWSVRRDANLSLEPIYDNLGNIVCPAHVDREVAEVRLELGKVRVEIAASRAEIKGLQAVVINGLSSKVDSISNKVDQIGPLVDVFNDIKSAARFGSFIGGFGWKALLKLGVGGGAIVGIVLGAQQLEQIFS